MSYHTRQTGSAGYTFAQHYVDGSTSPTYLLDQYLTYIDKIENLANTTVKNRDYILRPLLARLNKQSIADITIYEIDECCIQRSKEVKPSTLNIERQAMRSFFAYCQAYRMLEMQFDFRQIKRTKERPPQVVAFSGREISEVVSTTKHRQDQLIITLMYETGIRIGEVISLSVDDIRDTQIRVRGKGSKDRLVYMPPELAQEIRAYTNSKGIYTGCAFRPLQVHRNSPPDRYKSAYAVRDRIEREFARLGHKMHPHQLRHSFAVNWLEEGGDLRSLQKILGHDSLETTQRYLGLTDKYMAEIYSRTIKGSIIKRKDY